MHTYSYQSVASGERIMLQKHPNQKESPEQDYFKLSPKEDCFSSGILKMLILRATWTNEIPLKDQTEKKNEQRIFDYDKVKDK